MTTESFHVCDRCEARQKIPGGVSTLPYVRLIIWRPGRQQVSIDVCIACWQWICEVTSSRSGARSLGEMVGKEDPGGTS